ncbi:MAG TPA: FAD-dependent thymidylate synthase [Dehalococcoidia bacterium]|nr:FAD-dependent thymidylate synthase [Dehalococcoidia bacterium]
MKIIKPSVEFFGAVPTDYAGALAFIEKAGRTCYKSEDKITADSAEGFVKRLIKARHLAMVEHSNFVVRIPLGTGASERIQSADKYLNVFNDEDYGYIGGSLTAWVQTPYLAAKGMLLFRGVYGELFGLNVVDGKTDWQVCPHNEIPKALHRYSAKFICDRGVSHELVRHRPCSFAQESTRYVNYGGKDMEFIEPAGFEEWSPGNQQKFANACGRSEELYKAMLYGGLSPQQARAVLPNSLKTEIIITADAAEWAHIKKLRTHPSAHPDMVRIMNMMPWNDFLC